MNDGSLIVVAKNQSVMDKVMEKVIALHYFQFVGSCVLMFFFLINITFYDQLLSHGNVNLLI